MFRCETYWRVTVTSSVSSACAIQSSATSARDFDSAPQSRRRFRRLKNNLGGREGGLLIGSETVQQILEARVGAEVINPQIRFEVPDDVRASLLASFF